MTLLLVLSTKYIAFLASCRVLELPHNRVHATRLASRLASATNKAPLPFIMIDHTNPLCTTLRSTEPAFCKRALQRGTRGNTSRAFANSSTVRSSVFIFYQVISSAILYTCIFDLSSPILGLRRCAAQLTCLFTFAIISWPPSTHGATSAYR